MEEFALKEIFKNEESHWWFVGTRNIVFSQIDRYFNKNKGLKILDVGCGTGIVIKRLEKYGDTFGIDISNKAIEFCKKRNIKNILKANAIKIPFSNDNFNLVVSLDVLEHIKHDNNSISEIYRVLKKDGIALLTVPAFNFLWSNHDEALHHFRRYSIKEIKNKILKYDFDLIKISYYNFFFFLPILIFRILKKIYNKKGKEKKRKTDVINTPRIVNKLFTFILNVEAKILNKLNLPFGVSILVIIKKR